MALFHICNKQNAHNAKPINICTYPDIISHYATTNSFDTFTASLCIYRPNNRTCIVCNINAVQWNNRCLFLDPHKTQNTCRVGCRQSSLYSSKCLPQCHEPNGAAGGSLPICSKSLFINRRPKYSPRLQVTWSTYTVLNSFCESDNRSWTQKLYYNVYSNRPPSRVHISHQIFPAYSFVLQWYLG